MEKMIEDLLNRGYAYDTFREGNLFDSYDGLEADVDFWYGRYCEDVDAGVNDPDVGIVEYIAGKIDEEHPTENPEQFNSLMRWVREILPKIEKNWSVNIREAQIGGTMQYANGEASGRALAGDLANKGIRDITPGPNGRGQAEVDKTGVYVGVPMGPDKTAWANPVAAKNSMSPAAAARVDKFQKAYAAAPAKEKAAMQDWSPEKPDMSMNKNAQVVDNNTGTVMPTAQQPQAKSSILQKLGLKESLFNKILEADKPAKDEKTTFFESLIQINESSANKTANAIVKQLNNFDGTDAGAKELVNYISKFLGQANAQGEQGLQNDLPQFFQNHNGVENMILAAAAIRCKNVGAALNFYKRYGNQLGANINPDVVARAIQAAQENPNLALEQAQQQVQQ
jgi:hypothetical protein